MMFAPSSQSFSATRPVVAPGMVALHGNRLEVLAQTLAAWMARCPLGPLEQEVVLVQSNGMAEWVKMELAQTLGVSAAVRVELPGRFAWQMYRHVLGYAEVPRHTPLDKASTLWHTMQLLPTLVQQGATGVWEGIGQLLDAGGQGGDDAITQRYFLASKMADLLDQYQVYRPDWLVHWEQGRDGEDIMPAQPVPRSLVRHLPPDVARVPAQEQWQPALWRHLLAQLPVAQRQAIRPRLHQRVLDVLQTGQMAAPQHVPRRVVLFGMTHLPAPVLELLGALSARCQILLAVPNPCRFYWSDALDGRELFQRMPRKAAQPRHAERGAQPLATLDMAQMHAHAHPLLVAWGRQVRDHVRQLEAFDEAAQAAERMGLARIDFFDEDDRPDASLLQQVQQRIRDLVPLAEHAGHATAVPPDDHSVLFRVAHSPMREVEVLHDHLLDCLQHSRPDEGLQARDIVVMVPDIAQYAALIQAVFGQYAPEDARHIPFDIADMGAQAASPLLKAVQWLAELPCQRAGLSELGDLLAVPAVARRFGLDADAVAQLQAWMQGSGIRWGLGAAHRRALGLPAVGEHNSAWFGLQRMVLGFLSAAQPFDGIEPYAEIGGLAAAHVGALAQLLHRLQHWSQTLQTPASPTVWAQRWRSVLADFLEPTSEEELAAVALLEQALQDWLHVTADAGFEAALPLAVARHAWLDGLKNPAPTQRFHAGGITFCTLMPMRAIPFRIVCLLGMNDGDYPRKSVRQDMDLMALPGQVRPGDRRRAQDDRQLMLEALLSARDRLYISWVGRNVRDNSPRPPSVLVAQLRDYLTAGWGEAVVQQRTLAYPLQPFSSHYFEEGSRWQTWASEWRPIHHPDNSLPASVVEAVSATASASLVVPVWTLAGLGSFWRDPVKVWAQQRLQLHYQPLPEAIPDQEPLAIAGLERWAQWNALLHTLQPHARAGASPAQLQDMARQALQRQALAGALPLHQMGEDLQAQWLELLDPLLQRWVQSLQQWPQACERQRLQYTHARHPQWQVQDWLHGVHESADATAQGQRMRLHVKPSRCIDQPANRNRPQPLLRLEPLIPEWVQAVVVAACLPNTALHSRLIGLDATLEVAPLDAAQARLWLAQMLEQAAQGLQQPLPLAAQTGFAWLAARERTEEGGAEAHQSLATARSRYEGTYKQRGEVQDNPYLARFYPDFTHLNTDGRFEALAQTMLEPVRQWTQQCVRIVPYDR